jgi:hypothetical protein
MQTELKTPLEGFEIETGFAQRKGVCAETVRRARKRGLLDYLVWAGKIWIRTADGEALIRSQIKRRNPPRRPRRESLQQKNAETAAA